ncbi:Na(+)/H(+) antiporter subunit C [Rothia aerolata]|uniref:Na(+)/H(+) antiporter subunit C n=1 Tax=Rothia aerolata TaxID=1812262 RepID=A0A917MU67_9MICC|nr:Na(+)/H(+) antiporter subunit C [Rothia aerolata]GGH64056.1 hypothetical protein GCM10007359_15970 [Rothia aerolata]
MPIDLSLILVMGVMYGVGVYLILDRTMTRVLLGLMLLTNATNILIFHASGAAGLSPLYDKSIDPAAYSDPLPQALVLTSVVISFAVTALLLGIIYRSWLLSRGDAILDDYEDQQVAAKGAYDPEEDAVAEFDESEFDSNESTREREFAAFSQRRQQAEKKLEERKEKKAESTQDRQNQEGERA